MYVAKITGVWPKGVKGYDPIPGMKEPTETKEFATEADAKVWVLGDGLHHFRWPVYSVEIVEPAGEQVWRAYHSSNEILENKNELWWHKADPERLERQKADAERLEAVREGRIPRNHLSLREQFEVDNPLWQGPYFAWVPTTQTVDHGWIWLRTYWIRHSGLAFVNKDFFFD